MKMYKINNNADEQEKVPYVFEQAVLKYPEETKGLISIIIPIYSAKEEYLREALDSVVAQTFENWEAILVDDGSTNGNIEKICTEYAEKDSRFKYIRQNNEGTNLARKTGLENSRGEFIASLDSDDVYKPQFLEKMYAKIKDGNNDFVYFDFEGLGGIPPRAVTCYNFSENKLQNCHNIRAFLPNLCNKVIKRSIYAKVLFPQTYIVYGEDFIQNLSLLYYSKNAEFVSDRLYIYRLNNVISVSLSFNTISKEKQYAQRVIYTIASYLLMKRFFGTGEAEKAFADESNFGNFGDYFILDKSAILRNKIEYAENFVPAFLRSLKRSKNRSFTYKLRKFSLILAYKGFHLLFKILRVIRNQTLKIKIGGYKSRK